MRRFATFILIVSAVTATSLPAIDVRSEIIEPAQALLGSGYCYRSASPPCFDCSGYVSYIYRDAVEGLPRISRDMARFGTAVSREELQPGDLVFFATGGDPNRVTHVAIYIGQNSIIHAISDGPNRGISITELSARYWNTRYYGARRVLPVEEPTSGIDTIEYARGTYSGELQGGEPEGDGILEMHNGDVYSGEFRAGFFNGASLYIWADGSRYSGSFSNGLINGEGTYTPVDGPAVSGVWEEGRLVRSASAGTAYGTEATTYFEVKDSPWETYDGIVTGDFYAWLDEEQSAFESWKENN